VSTKAFRTNDPTNDAGVARVDTEVRGVVIPVSMKKGFKEPRRRNFYGKLGWRFAADYYSGKTFRVIQCTPPCSGNARSSSARTFTQSAPPVFRPGLVPNVSPTSMPPAKNCSSGSSRSAKCFHDSRGPPPVYACTDEPYLFGNGPGSVSGCRSIAANRGSLPSFPKSDVNCWPVSRKSDAAARSPSTLRRTKTFASGERAGELRFVVPCGGPAHGKHEARTGEDDRTGVLVRDTWFASKSCWHRAFRNERLRSDRHRRRARRALQNRALAKALLSRA